MVYWVREFKDRLSGDRFRDYGEATDLPSFREKIADRLSEPDWLEQEIYVHDAELDMQLPGNHELYVLSV
jgi:hypothetical protein